MLDWGKKYQFRTGGISVYDQNIDTWRDMFDTKQYQGYDALVSLEKRVMLTL
jgi:hypothetical protein